MEGNGDPPLSNPVNPSSTPPTDSVLASSHAAQRLFAASHQSAGSGGRTPFNPPALAVGHEVSGDALGIGGLGGSGAGRGTFAGARRARGRGAQGCGRGAQVAGRGILGANLGSQDSEQEVAGHGSQLNAHERAAVARGKKKADDTVNKGNRPNTHLNSVGYEEVREDFFNLTAIHLSKRQMRNKWDKLKPDYLAWRKLMRKQTGPGWDRRRGVIDMDNEWWKKAKAEIPGCGKFRKKPLQNEEDLSLMFSDIINDQSDHWNPMSSNPIIPPADEIPEDVDNGNVNKSPEDCDHDAGGGIVVATMVLHNFIREHGGEDEDFARYDRDPNFVATIPERYNKFAYRQAAAASDVSTNAINAPTMDDFRDELATSLSLAWN